MTGEIVFLPDTPNMLPPNENGMRDMVRIPAGTVVQIIAHFDVPGLFVWHCHILDHEDHEMMLPFEVVTGNKEDKHGKKDKHDKHDKKDKHDDD